MAAGLPDRGRSKSRRRLARTGRHTPHTPTRWHTLEYPWRWTGGIRMGGEERVIQGGERWKGSKTLNCEVEQKWYCGCQALCLCSLHSSYNSPVNKDTYSVHPAAIWQKIQKYPLPYLQCSFFSEAARPQSILCTPIQKHVVFFLFFFFASLHSCNSHFVLQAWCCNMTIKWTFCTFEDVAPWLHTYKDL